MTISGRLDSGNPRCLASRHIQIFRYIYDGFFSDKIARFDANRNGTWVLHRGLNPGVYFAKVDSKPGCRYDVSPNTRLGG